MVRKGRKESSQIQNNRTTIKDNNDNRKNRNVRNKKDSTKTRNRTDEIKKKKGINQKTHQRSKKVTSNKNKAIIKQQTQKTSNNRARNSKKRKNNKKRKDKLLIALFVAIIFLIINVFLLYQYQTGEKKVEQLKKEKQTELKKEKERQIELEKEREERAKLTDIIFLGDSITDFYDLEKYYDIPVINSGTSGWTTDDILGDLDDKVFQYNAKKIFLLIGTNDFRDEKDADYVYQNIKKIVSEIRKENKYVTIYIESIYPVNNTDDEKIDHDMVGNRSNETIKKTNKKLEAYCKTTKDVNYINMFDKLKDKDGNLDLDYTKEGLHMSDKGYELITDVLKEYL